MPPQFEVFGGANSALHPKIEFGPAPIQNRTWFASSMNDHLLQLQSDRFMLNWRASESRQPSSYPRFEPILNKFLVGLAALDELSSLRLGCRLAVIQAEVAYVNLIKLQDFKESTAWVSFLKDYPADGLESISCATGKVIADSQGRPVARLHTQIQTVYWGFQGESKGLHITFTVRGATAGVEISQLGEVLLSARALIVHEFARITSSVAHEKWERET